MTAAERQRRYMRRLLAARATLKAISSHRPLPPQDPDRDLLQDDYEDGDGENFGPKTEEERWQWSAANLMGDVIAASAYWKREFGEWQKFRPPPELLKLMDDATEAWDALRRALERHE